MQKEYEGLLRNLLRLLTARFKDDVVSVVLFGSVARGTAQKASDVDVCIVIRNLPKSRFQRNKLLTPILSSLHESPSYRELRARGYFPHISPVLYTPEEMGETKPLFLDMVDDAEILLDDGAFKNKMADLKKRMTELQSRKVVREDGTWYWILKPGMKLGEVITL